MANVRNPVIVTIAWMKYFKALILLITPISLVGQASIHSTIFKLEKSVTWKQTFCLKLSGLKGLKLGSESFYSYGDIFFLLKLWNEEFIRAPTVYCLNTPTRSPSSARPLHYSFPTSIEYFQLHPKSPLLPGLTPSLCSLQQWHHFSA